VKFARRSVLQSKVARRILFLFVVSALLPLGVLAAVVLTTGSTRLRQEGVRQLQQACKARGMAACERLQLLDAEMRMAIPDGTAQVEGVTTVRAVAMGYVGVGQTKHEFFGEGGTVPALSNTQWDHLGKDRPLVVTSGDASGSAVSYLVRAIDPAQSRGETLWARLRVDDLLDFETLSYTRRLAILDSKGRPMAASVAPPLAMTAAAQESGALASRAAFEWNEQDEAFVGTAWQLFLKVEFGTPGWTFVLSESRSAMEAPILAFEQALILSIILSLAVISLVSIVQIRRTLGPIASLHAGTRMLTTQQFDHRVLVNSGDEFEELADSFNTMAERTGHHLRALQAMGDVQRSILATHKTSAIIASFLSRVPELIECVSAGVLLVKTKDGLVDAYLRVEDSAPRHLEGRLASSLLQSLGTDVESHVLERAQLGYGLLAGFGATGVDRLTLLPIHIDGELEAVIVVGCERSVQPPSEDVARVRGLSGQMAVALANARLMGELEQLNWGAIRALARAIDAKSPWTQGHSDRVTNLACRMGEALRVSEEELQTLRRGALLHDVGKIGSPAELLEKQDRLTDDEFERMKEHVRLGARIVQPIGAFRDALPIVLQHHERLDGSGYPAGLRGEEISYLARIVAVADSFDAICSDRPYRKGAPVSKALDIIRAEAGTTLDEDAVAALVYVVKNQPDVLTGQSDETTLVINPVEAVQ